MNIYAFIDSRDIRAHLQKIRYEFTPVQYAYLVWASHQKLLDEKQAAWTLLMACQTYWAEGLAERSRKRLNILTEDTQIKLGIKEEK